MSEIRDALIAEMLGDVGKLHDEVKALPAALQPTVEHIEARAAAFQAAGDRLAEVLQRMVQVADTIAGQRLGGQAGNSEVVMRQLLAEAFRAQGQELAKVIHQSDSHLAERLAESRGAEGALLAERHRAILQKLNASAPDPVNRTWVFGVVLATAIITAAVTVFASRFF